MSKSSITTEMGLDGLPTIHPGEILREELSEIGLSANAFSRAIDVPPNRITEIMNGARGVSPDTALRLARYFGTSPKFWLNLQTTYDLKKALEANGDAIAKVAPRAA